MTILSSLVSFTSISNQSKKNNKYLSFNSKYTLDNNSVSRLPPGEASYFSVPDEWIKNYNSGVSDIQGPTSC